MLWGTAAAVVQRLGPAFVKCGQLLATRRDLLGDDIIRHLLPLQDRMRPISARVARQQIRRELGAQLESIFSEFSDAAVASGSIASVYRARLLDGRAVAVKLLRPGVIGRIEWDLRLIRTSVRALQLLPGMRGLNMLAVVNEVGATLRRQTDFIAEAEAIRQLRSALTAHDVVIPAVVDALCTPAVITMEFVDAFAQPVLREGEEARRGVRVGLRALYRMIFLEGLVHCDMHCGNFRLLPDGRAALIDCGFVAAMPARIRVAFAEFFFAMACGDGQWCANIALALAESYPRRLDRDRFAEEIANAVNHVAGRPVAEFSVASFVARIFDIQRRYQVRSTPAFMMAIIALLTFEGLAKEIDCTIDFQREAIPYLLRAGVRTTVTPDGQVSGFRSRYAQGSRARVSVV